MIKKILSVLLALCMVLTLTPMDVMAEGNDESATLVNVGNIQLSSYDDLVSKLSNTGYAELSKDETGKITIKMLQNINGRLCFEVFDEGTDIIFDINGKVIDGTGHNETICLENNCKATLTLTGNGTYLSGTNNVLFSGRGTSMIVQSGMFKGGLHRFGQVTVSGGMYTHVWRGIEVLEGYLWGDNTDPDTKDEYLYSVDTHTHTFDQEIIAQKYQKSGLEFYKSCYCSKSSRGYEGEVTFVISPHQHEGEQNIQWQAWHGEDITAEGYYYLEYDVEVTENIELHDYETNIEADAIICLNGYTLGLRRQGGINIAEGVEVTICDCGTSGRIYSDYSCEIIVNQGTINISSGTSGRIYSDYSCEIIVNQGTINISSGTVQGNGLYNSVVNQENGIVNINGGSVYCRDGVVVENRSTGTVNIKNGTVYGNRVAVENRSTGTVNINGGSVHSDRDGVAVENRSTGTVNIKSGTVYGAWGAVRNGDGGIVNIEGGSVYIDSDYGTDRDGVAVENRSTGTINISGGSIENISNSATGIISLTGGIYSEKGDDAWLADGYEWGSNDASSTADTYPYAVKVKHDHIYNMETVDEIYLKSAADCQNPAIYYKSCSICGMSSKDTGYDVTFTNGSAHAETEVRDAVSATCTEEGYTGDTYCKSCGTKVESGETITVLEHTDENTDHICDICGTELAHDNATDWKYDASGHWHECSCGVKSDEARHSGGTATCKVLAVCAICGVPYGELSSTHGETEVRGAYSATCIEEGYKGDIWCKVCNTKLKSGDIITVLGHKDENTDHVCDNGCDVEQGTCGDTNLDHKCDYGCEKNYGTHEAASGKHSCDYCGDIVTNCEDNDDNHICDICGTELAHDNATEWKYDESGHWHECSCGVKSDEARHSGGTATCKVLAVCDICGESYGELSSTHGETEVRGAYSATCTEEGYTGDTYCKSCGTKVESGETITVLGHTDENTDHACDNGCDVEQGICADSNLDHKCDYGCEKSYGTHEAASGKHSCDYCGASVTSCEDNDDNCICDICGRELAHSYLTEWKSDASGHWQECSCGVKSDKTAHSGGTATCKVLAVCDICGESYGELSSTHSETELRGAYSATCTEGGYTGDTHCKVCDTKLQNGETITALGHKDENTDHACDNGCGVEQGICGDINLDHKCDYGCEKTFGICADADLDHACDYGCVKSYGTHEAASGKHSCDYCSDMVTSCADSDGNRMCDICGIELEHSYSTEWKFDALGHWHECSCGVKSDKAVHSGGTASCEVLAVCAICGVSYGELSSIHGETELRGAYSATCTEGGYTGDTYCKLCGELVKSGETITALGHTDENTDHACDNGCDVKQGICEDTDLDHECDYGCEKSYGTHEAASGKHNCDYCGDTVTNCEDNDDNHICDLCGTELAHDNSTEWKSDASGHWQECSCGVKNDKAIHTSSGKATETVAETCTICGYEITPKLEVIPTPTQTVSGKPFIQNDTGKSGWELIRGQIADAKEDDIIVVDMNGTTKVPGEVFDDIKGKDITITLDMGNNISWTINGKTITADKVSDINFEIKVGTKENPINTIPVEVINKLTGERHFINISLVHDGELGLKAILNINLGAKNKGYFANLFYYNEQYGVLQFIWADDIDEYGTAHLVFTHASEYTIVMDEGIMQSSITSPKTGDENQGLSVGLLACVLLFISMGCFFVARKRKKA